MGGLRTDVNIPIQLIISWAQLMKRGQPQKPVEVNF